ncbi:MAG TPA: acyl-CoA dehydrogenase family protein [Ramlibacter sp.]|uniref:acyl-CoA dehydrogenase family protein n=1 Tax=Ramlibacter sp. TaxID=1917967 RepID=UPI002C5C1D13|nr:acyl-CoA dehydrogenase family protein [Ramlibacter sp.]HVZ45786.1 acyl-CoA dehydrogenase family protein [Ramlibacter sp.]
MFAPIPRVPWQLEELPFFDESHRELAQRIRTWSTGNERLLGHPMQGTDERAFALELLASLGKGGFLRYAVPHPRADGTMALDVRGLCVLREALAYDSFLADSFFVMQGLGTAPVWRHPDAALRDPLLDACREGRRIAALALTEPDAGSDLAQVATTARLEGDRYVLNGQKAWITNGGLADQYVVVARTGEAAGAKGLSAFLVPADAPGLSFSEPVELVAHHPIAHLTFENCTVPREALVGAAGTGFKAAMAAFDVFRPSVGAAALGAARRALAETVQRVKQRRMFGQFMSELGAVQAKVADMAADVDAAAMVVYRAAWIADVRGGRFTKEAAVAKLVATEYAQRVIDTAVQLFGALGVARGSKVEELYRDIRPTRIYEGASEVQRLVIARNVLA